MAQEFGNEITILLWEYGNPHYRWGHAAFRVRQGGRVEFFNYDAGDGTDYRQEAGKMVDSIGGRYGSARNDPRVKMLMAKHEQNLQQRSLQDQMELGHTASAKVKLPIWGAEGITWGLTWYDGTWRHLRNERERNLYKTSPSAVALVLESLHADAFVRPPYETHLKWDVSFLDRWARQVRARLDELNRKAQEFLMYMQLHMGKGAHQKNLTGRRDQVMTVQEWKSLSKEGSFIRSSRIQRLDKLLAEYHSRTMDRTRVALLVEMFDLVWEYCQESTTGTRAVAVMNLGAQICEEAKKGYPLSIPTHNSQTLREANIN